MRSRWGGCTRRDVIQMPQTEGDIRPSNFVTALTEQEPMGDAHQGAVSVYSAPQSNRKVIYMSNKVGRMVAVAAFTAFAAFSAATSVPARAGDMNNALGGALGGVAGAAVGGAVGGSTGAVIGGAVGGGAGGAVTSSRKERTGAIVGGALGGGAGTAAGNAMGGRTGGLVGAAVGGGAGAALGGNISRSNAYANDSRSGGRNGRHHRKYRHRD